MQGAIDRLTALQEPLLPGLYIVATPIGNLGDITLRAVQTLQMCTGIACEDTRVTGKLLHHLGISKPMWRYDDHTDKAGRERLLDRMTRDAVALVSDAGTPLVSDPGYRLVHEAQVRDIPVTTLPGPCAAIVGLTISGLPNDRFFFAGFLPAKDKARNNLLTELAGIDATLIFYETGPRLARSLRAIEEVMGRRDVAIARELTKLHEECVAGDAGELGRKYEGSPPKGEIVLLVSPPASVESSEAEIDELLRVALESMKPSQAAAEVAKATGQDRKTIYRRALASLRT